jgi:hypothetical protein
MNSNQNLKVELKELKLKYKELSKKIKSTDDYINRAEVINSIKTITKTLTEAPEVNEVVSDNVAVVLPDTAFTNNTKPKKVKALKKDKN